MAILNPAVAFAWVNVQNVKILSALALSTFVLYYIGSLVYNVYFHPLARYPGPLLWRASRIPYVLALRRGRIVQLSKEFHDYYGSHIVRLAPEELSFTDGAAWKDIYVHRQGHQTFQKNSLWLNRTMNGVDSIFSANDEDHARIKKLLNNSFSDKMMREQEYLVRTQVDLFIEQMRAKIASKSDIFDMTQWFHWLTFDIVGYLAFSQSFATLRDETERPWCAMLVGQFLYTTLSTSCRYFPWLDRFMRMMTPKSALYRRAQIFKKAQAKVHQRLNATVDTPDFMKAVLRYNNEKGMSIPEIESSFPLILIAGSETTATSLVGTALGLMQQPDALAKLVAEVRGTFNTEAEITYSSCEKLPYLNAVISEGLRVSAAVPWGHPRTVPPGGDTVAGEWLPGGTVCYLNAYAAYNSSLNFPNPSTFSPERFLPDPITNEKPIIPSAYEPFAVGARACIGKKVALLEMRVIIARMVWNFDMEVPGGGQVPFRWEDQHVWTLWVKEPLLLRFSEGRKGGMVGEQKVPAS